MGFLSGIPIVGSVLDGLTGEAQARAINKQTKSSAFLQQQHLDMLKQIFGEAMNSIADARAAGAFDASKIRVSVQRSADRLLGGIAARGLIAGAKEGDTVQSERLAKGAIEGGKALEDVEFEALSRELQALNAALPSAGSAGAAIGAINETGRRGLEMSLANQSLVNQRLGTLASIGSLFFNSDNGAKFKNTRVDPNSLDLQRITAGFGFRG